MNLLILKFVHSRNVFPNDVELDVDDGSLLDGVEVGVVEGVGDDADLEGVGSRAADREADAVDGYAALIDGEVAVAHHLPCAFMSEGVLVAALLVLYGNARGGLVNVSLHDVPVQASVHQHRALHVHFVAHPEQPEVAALQCLAHGGYGVGVVLEADNGQADAIVSNALVDAQLLDEGAGKGQVDVVLLVLYGNHACHAFNDTGEHRNSNAFE